MTRPGAVGRPRDRWRSRSPTLLALVGGAAWVAGCHAPGPGSGPVSSAAATGGASPVVVGERAGPPLDPDRYRSVILVDVDGLRRLDPRAPKDDLTRDVIGADPLLDALFPEAFRSFRDVVALEYRARGFAAPRWGLRVRFDRPVADALADRGLHLGPRGERVPLPSARPTLGAAVEGDALFVAPRDDFDAEWSDADAPSGLHLGQGEVAAWRLTHVDEELRGQGAALPRTLELRARRWHAPALIQLEVRAHYPDAEAAEHGRHHWDGVRRRLVDDPWVGLVGLDRPLRGRSVRRDGNELALVTTLRASELRLLLGAVASMHGRPEAADAP